jgi:hypothetical protein
MAFRAAQARRAGYLCSNCATSLGGIWPRDHRATFHEADCPLCAQKKMLGSWDDWEWPDSRLGKEARRTREF